VTGVRRARREEGGNESGAGNRRFLEKPAGEKGGGTKRAGTRTRRGEKKTQKDSSHPQSQPEKGGGSR